MNSAQAGCSRAMRMISSAPPAAGAIEERLLPAVVTGRVETEARRRVDQVLDPHPAGEGAGGLADIGLAVVADPEREELQEFAGEVLVGPLLAADTPVQPDEHGEVGQHVGEESRELAQGVPAEALILPEHQVNASDLVIAGREVVVPEERHLLAEGVRVEDDAVEPVGPQPKKLRPRRARAPHREGSR